MKLAFMLTLLLIAAGEAQAETRGCMTKIVSSLKWQPITESQIQCVASSLDSKDSRDYLCSSDKKDLSDKFKKYLYYQAQYEQAWQEYQQATDPAAKDQALFKLQIVEDHWSIAGFRSETDEQLNSIESVKYFCINR